MNTWTPAVRAPGVSVSGRIVSTAAASTRPAAGVTRVGAQASASASARPNRARTSGKHAWPARAESAIRDCRLFMVLLRSPGTGCDGGPPRTRARPASPGPRSRARRTSGRAVDHLDPVRSGARHGPEAVVRTQDVGGGSVERRAPAGVPGVGEHDVSVVAQRALQVDPVEETRPAPAAALEAVDRRPARARRATPPRAPDRSPERQDAERLAPGADAGTRDHEGARQRVGDFEQQDLLHELAGEACGAEHEVLEVLPMEGRGVSDARHPQDRQLGGRSFRHPPQEEEPVRPGGVQADRVAIERGLDAPGGRGPPTWGTRGTRAPPATRLRHPRGPCRARDGSGSAVRPRASCSRTRTAARLVGARAAGPAATGSRRTRRARAGSGLRACARDRRPRSPRRAPRRRGGRARKRVPARVPRRRRRPRRPTRPT